MSNTYKNQEVIQLTEREQCRKKLPIFFGDFSNYQHSLREILLNARDEVINNYENGVISIKLYEDNETVEILDSGRGINLWGETDGQPNYFLLLQKLWAGGNHSNLELGIASTGTNSVGLTCTNYCAETFEVTSYKNFKCFKAIYKDGGELVKIEEGENSEIEHGTRVKFKQDKTIYTETKFDEKEVEEICLKISSTSPQIKYIFEHNGEIKEFQYDSQEEYLEDNIVNKLTPFIQFKQKQYEEKIKIESKDYIEKDSIVCNLSLSTEPTIETFLNGTWLIEGGSILDGIVDGIKKALQKNIKDKKTKLTNQDILMSFNIHCLFTSTNPSFSGQTKFSSASPLYKKIASKYIQDEFEIVKSEQPKLIEQMVKHLEVINNANKKTEESRKKISKALQEKSTICTTRPKKFVPCRSKNPKEISFGVLEGDSAEGTVKLARDSKTMCFLPLKGKPLNCFKSSLNDILNNDEIIATFQILGCGMSYFGKPIKGIDKFNIDNLQVNEYLIITDQDEDGYHLQSLCIGNMYVLAPELIKAGVVKVLTTPLYIIKTKDEEIWAYDEIERGNIVNKLKQNSIKFKEQRFKGLGGLSVEAMAKCLDKETRKCYTITMEDAEECIKYLELFLGEDVEPRKDFIMTHAHEYEVEKYYE